MTSLPELGPYLGRLCALADPGKRWVPLDDIRLDLATGVLDLASAARDFGDDRGAVVGGVEDLDFGLAGAGGVDVAFAVDGGAAGV